MCQCVCQCAKFDKFLPARSHFDSKRPENSKIPIRCLWTAFCVPLSFICYEKQSFRMQIVTLRHSRVILKPAHNSAQQRTTAMFWKRQRWLRRRSVLDRGRSTVGYFVPLNGPLNGHPPNYSLYVTSIQYVTSGETTHCAIWNVSVVYKIVNSCAMNKKARLDAYCLYVIPAM